MRGKRLAFVCIGIAVAVVLADVVVSQMLKSVQANRDAARRNMSQVQLKMLGLAMAQYNSAYQRFPARAIFSKEGKPLLSWRVQVLPYIDQGELYKEFHLDEAWDSPHNRPLIARIPPEFVLPGEEAADGKTHYVVPVGKGTAFEGDTGFAMFDISDGLSNTIFAVESDNAVIWTKPDDLEVDMDNPLNGLGNLRPKGFNALFGDDRIVTFPKTIAPKTLRALFTRAGGELIYPDMLP